MLELRRRSAPLGVTVVDCGVSGGPDAAARGELVCMIGGSAEEVDQVRPVLDVISCLVLHTAPPGGGLATKLARNRITHGSSLAAFEAQELAEAAGIDLLKLGEAAPGERQADRRCHPPHVPRDGGAWPEDTDAGLLGMMRAGSEVTHKDLVSILALGDELGGPPAGRADRAPEWPHLRLRQQSGVTGASLGSGIRRERA